MLKEFNLILTDRDVQLIVNALAPHPYAAVVDTIHSIQTQCAAQAEASETAQKEDAA
jgi:hypothetical protein